MKNIIIMFSRSYRIKEAKSPQFEDRWLVSLLSIGLSSIPDQGKIPPAGLLSRSKNVTLVIIIIIKHVLFRASYSNNQWIASFEEPYSCNITRLCNHSQQLTHQYVVEDSNL